MIAYTGVTIGTMTTLIGAITLATPGDQAQLPLGWGATGLGVAMLATGGVFYYLEAEALKELEAEDEPEEEKSDTNDDLKSY